jgi:ABC-type branched-subunit amino acid transport system substrate-binding protein
VKNVGKPDRAAVRDAVRATKNYQGVLGAPLSFDDKGDVAGGMIFVKVLSENLTSDDGPLRGSAATS